jgi:hypothetical protein
MAGKRNGTAAPVRQPWPSKGPPTKADYDRDVFLWSQEQGRLLRAGRFAELDIGHLAEEIEGMGKNQRRDLAARMARLTARLLAWRCEQDSRSGLRAMIAEERKRIALEAQGGAEPQSEKRIGGTACGWTRAFYARAEPRVNARLPDACPWTMEQAADLDFWPAASKPEALAGGLAARRPG